MFAKRRRCMTRLLREDCFFSLRHRGWNFLTIWCVEKDLLSLSTSKLPIETYSNIRNALSLFSCAVFANNMFGNRSVIILHKARFKFFEIQIANFLIFCITFVFKIQITQKPSWKFKCTLLPFLQIAQKVHVNSCFLCHGRTSYFFKKKNVYILHLFPFALQPSVSADGKKYLHTIFKKKKIHEASKHFIK